MKWDSLDVEKISRTTGAPFSVRPNMIATFLKTVDGDFDYGAICASLLFAAIISLEVWILYRALKKGRIPIGAGRWGSPVIWIEREKNPLGYWFVFALFCIVIALFVFAIYARCSELWQ